MSGRVDRDQTKWFLFGLVVAVGFPLVAGLFVTLPTEVEVIGRLHPMRLVVSRTWVVPVVARIPHPVELVGHEAEVDRVFWVPLHEFTQPGTYHEEHWSRFTLPDGDLHEVSILFFDLDDETVWGLTGRIVASLLEAVHTAPPHAPPPTHA